MTNENFEKGLDASVQDLFEHTGLAGRVRKTPDPEALDRFKTAFRNDLTSAHVKGQLQGRQEAVMNTLRILENLPYRAGRKSCVEAVREHFKVDDE